jgi:hypothetical protein
MTRVQRYRWIARLSVGLWVPTLLGLGVWANTESGGGAGVDDGRTVVVVNADEASIVSEVMRDNLRSVHQILDAVSRQDRAAVSRLAQQAADTPGPARRSPSLGAKLPPQWRPMGGVVHDQFRSLAQAAADPQAKLDIHLAQLTAACLACHDTMRLVVDPSAGRASSPRTQ